MISVSSASLRLRVLRTCDRARLRQGQWRSRVCAPSQAHGKREKRRGGRRGGGFRRRSREGDLERQDLARLPIKGHDLGVEHEARHALAHDLRDDGQHVGVLGGVVLGVAAEDLERPVLGAVDLAPLPVVLVLARERLVREAVQHLADALGGVREHGLHRDAGPEEALGRELLQRGAQQLGDAAVVARQLAEHLLDDLPGAVEGLLAAGGAGRGAGRRAERRGVGQGDQDGLLRQADAHLALQVPDDVLRLRALAGDEERLDLVLLLGPGVLAGHAGDLQERLEDPLDGERLGRKHRALRAP